MVQGFILVYVSGILSVLMVVYLFVGRTFGRVVYGGAIVLGVAVISLIGPRVFWEFANPLDASGTLRVIPLSCLFVFAAPWLKRAIVRARQRPPQSDQ